MLDVVQLNKLVVLEFEEDLFSYLLMVSCNAFLFFLS